ncbi:MAG: restriction endonuclease subunit S [Planctomycetaceae bacterium]|jgi:type I restriction enzyme S subunit|nr:restriction endonuclease subunit S [Planctomycetaceae bacterium]
MNKNEKTALPQLRFLQFKDSPAWNISSFGKLIIPVKDRAGTKKYTLMSVTSGVGLIPQIEKFGREIAGNAYSSYYVIKKNDFAYNKSATKQFPEGYISMLTEYDEAALPNSIFACFRIVDDGCVPKFFYHLFHNNYHGSWLRKYIEVGARAHGSLSVDTKHLWDMPVALPRTEEQRKIADCLSSLDDLIAAEDKKLEALKAHKKGLMQKLFPAEGKTVPEWRFIEFRGSGEWEEKPLAQVGNIITGSTPSTADVDNYGGNKMFVSPADMSELKYVVETKTKLTGKGFSTTRKILANSVLFVCIGATIGKVALNKCECATNQQINAIVPFEDYISDFIYYTLDLNSSKISKLAGKQAVPIVNKSLFSSIVVSIPEYDEQQKIADCLSGIDDLITEQANKIEALKAHKKGLMQGLFPSIEEVGG